MSVVITAIDSIASVGFSAAAISAAVRGPISCFREAEEYTDSEGSRVVVAEIPILEDVGDDEDQESRIRSLGRFCLERLINESFPTKLAGQQQVYMLIGLPTAARPGPRYQGDANELQFIYSEVVRTRFDKWAFRFFESGNPSAFEALDYARRFLVAHPETICVVGGIDSLLDSETLDYFEDDSRLKSASYGRHQGLVPGEGIGFLIVESGEFAKRRHRQPLAQVLGIGIGSEPSPVISTDPSTFTGLSDACRLALSNSGSSAESICTVIGDLNGEFFRAKEWAHAELRCLGTANRERELWHPADCFGDVGAASGALLINLAVTLLRQEPTNSRTLCFCSDDEHMRGAAVLAPYSDGP